MHVAIVIPALNPGNRLVDYCRELRGATDGPILLVDDGSSEERRSVFQDCLSVGKDIHLLRHGENRGKGRALKTAFADLLGEREGLLGCVTCDSDGQHSVPDVVRCVAALKESPRSLVLGCRTFDGDDVPWKSRFGNHCIRFLFLLVSGYRYRDTQTGLRAIPADFMRELLDVPGERFEFESEMLLRLHGRPLVQLPIRTIYENRNEGTHFKPLRDSLKIVGVLLRAWGRRFSVFILISLSSCALDLGLFHVLHRSAVHRDMPGRLFFSVGIARCVSLLFNYLCNRHVAFRNEGRRSVFGGRALGKYLLLAGALFLASYSLTKAVVYCLPGVSVTLIKAGVDTILFLASYMVQRIFIFGPGRG